MNVMNNVIAALDQACNGTHLGSVPNHDDSLYEIAWELDSPRLRGQLLRHAERLEKALEELRKEVGK